MDIKFILYFVVPTVLGVVILLAGGILMLVAYNRKKKAGEIDIADWGTVGGKVISGRLEKSPTQLSGKDNKSAEAIYVPVVDYVYTVEGVEHQENKVFPEAGEGLSQSAAQEILDKYPVNAYVAVRYNPKDPTESALMRHPQRPSYTQMAGWLLTGFGLSVCCFTSLMAVIILGRVQ